MFLKILTFGRDRLIVYVVDKIEESHFCPSLNFIHDMTYAYFTAIYTQEQRRREIAHKLEREEQEERMGAANEKRELVTNKQQMEKQILCFEEKIEIEKMVSLLLSVPP